jgi:ABC-type bacteriocin/lantibiotic exporter with double-glycine peptidase domain
MKTRAVGKPAGRESLDLQMEQQQQTLWCWAAVSVSVKHFYDASFAVRQCEQANTQSNGRSCCDDPASCNHEGYLMAALQYVKVFRELVERSVPFERILEEIHARRPVCARIEWTDKTGHFVCIDGYDGRTLLIKDPWHGSSRVPYDEFSTRYRGIGRWTHTYLTTR